MLNIPIIMTSLPRRTIRPPVKLADGVPTSRVALLTPPQSQPQLQTRVFLAPARLHATPSKPSQPSSRPPATPAKSPLTSSRPVNAPAKSTLAPPRSPMGHTRSPLKSSKYHHLASASMRSPLKSSKSNLMQRPPMKSSRPPLGAHRPASSQPLGPSKSPLGQLRTLPPVAKSPLALTSSTNISALQTPPPPTKRRRYSRHEVACAFTMLALAAGSAAVYDGQRKGDCPLCNKFYERLDRHIKIHYQMRSHACPVCGREFTQGIHLQRHMISRHDPQRYLYTCDICGKKLSRKDKLLDHIRSIHPGRCTASSGEPNTTFQCTICDKRLSRRDTLLYHMDICRLGLKRGLMTRHLDPPLDPPTRRDSDSDVEVVESQPTPRMPTAPSSSAHGPRSRTPMMVRA